MNDLWNRIRNAWNRNAVISFFGVTGMGFFLSFLILAGYGTDPYTFMNRSVARVLGTTLGNWQLILNLLLLLFVFIVNRRLIGFGTIFNMILVGYYADFFCWLWGRILPGSLFTAQPIRSIIFAAALFGFVVSAAIYMNAEAGLAPYDAACKILAGWFSFLPFFITRMACDFLTILIGLLTGGRPTIGIILIALFLGPVITVVGRIMKKIRKNSSD
ncbi:MAG: hypothetical protein K6G16_06715 [Lachnospiraceae bacterium]|nr:hypothetical protein [Lachnospiraceae bacterium]